MLRLRLLAAGNIDVSLERALCSESVSSESPGAEGAGRRLMMLRIDHSRRKCQLVMTARPGWGQTEGLCDLALVDTVGGRKRSKPARRIGT